MKISGGSWKDGGFFGGNPKEKEMHGNTICDWFPLWLWVTNLWCWTFFVTVMACELWIGKETALEVPGTSDILLTLDQKIFTSFKASLIDLCTFRPCPGQPNGQNLQGKETRNSMWFWMTRWAVFWSCWYEWECPLVVGKHDETLDFLIGKQHLLWMLSRNSDISEAPHMPPMMAIDDVTHRLAGWEVGCMASSLCECLLWYSLGSTFQHASSRSCDPWTISVIWFPICGSVESWSRFKKL